ncbi:hypothetical protein FOMPIDRAFT_59929 [Fomitopsis schrenkii]|uniref:IRG-type G domain-containing protein n=1 Tax=Fomitopsis schrenkii TaxID=2126942 RepID=S8F4F7_FOMSC|nr:hypothetical protein FOMPIDRAFT_59929 [Fomitopsis schrenkii]
MRRRLQYEPGLFHFAVSGMSGSGKSSLVNAFRGLRNTSKRAAPVGVVETTSKVVRYPDTPGNPYVWYDVPGAGTLSIPDWQYFTDQGLYIFDCIIVAIDARFTATDIAILRNCVFFQIPTFIVRSKSKQHIENVAKDLPSEDASGLTLERARETYIRETRANIEENLKTAELPQQRVYLVDKDILVRVVKGKPVKGAIDELALLQDITKSIAVTRARPED